MTKIFRRKNISGIKRQAGAALIVVVIFIVVIATLTVGICAINFTTFMNQVAAQKTAKLLYLSESGARIVVSEYKAALLAGGTTAANDVLTELHGQIFVLPDNKGKITLSTYAYWFRAVLPYPVGTTTITVCLPGDVPPEEADGEAGITFPDDGMLILKKEGQPEEKADYATASIGSFNAAGGGTPVTFVLKQSFTDDIEPGDEFYIGCVYDSTEVSVNQGDDLTIDLENEDWPIVFPPEKGTIFIISSNVSYLYCYDARIVNGTEVTFTNVRRVEGAQADFPLTVGGGKPTEIYIGKSIAVRTMPEYGH